MTRHTRPKTPTLGAARQRRRLAFWLLLLLLGCDDASTGVEVDAGLRIPRDMGAPDTAVPEADAERPTADAEAPGPDAEIPDPDAALPELDAEVPAPDAALPEPDAEAPEPDAALPAPDAEAPEPDAEAPEPDAEALEPDAEAPEPDAEAPEPDAEAPEPDAEAPEPDAEAPEPDAGGPPVPPILVTDGDANRIFALDEAGERVDEWEAPGMVRGVTHDRREPDGFWVLVNEPAALVRLGWDGAEMRTIPLGEPPFRITDPRGLDYWLDAEPAGDRLVLVGLNGNRIEVSEHVRVEDGGRESEVSFGPAFADGYWGVHAVVDGTAFEQVNIERLSTRPGPFLLEFQRSAVLTRAVRLAEDIVVRGIARQDADTAAVAHPDGNEIVFVDLEGGAIIDRLPTPGIAPLGLSLRDAVP